MQSPPHLQRRLQKLEALCSEQGISAAIVYGRGSNLGPATKSHGYMRYLCDWDGHQNDSVLIVRPGQAPVLLVTGIFSKFFSERYYWIEDTQFVRPPQLGAKITQLCAPATASGGRIGLIGTAEMPVSLWLPLNEGLGKAEHVNLEPYLDEWRVVKDDHQLSKHKAAAEVCDLLFDTLRKEIKTPRPAFQLQAELERVARYAGSEFCMTWLTVGPQADYCRFYKDECMRVPQAGDQVLLGIYLMLDGHWGHAIRSGTMGTPTEPQQEVYDVASSMWEAMLAALGPNRDLASVHNAAEDIITTRYPAVHEDVFRFRHGHGLGHTYEDPVVSLAFPQAYDAGAKAASMDARAGMLFEIHPNLFVPGLGGSAIGDMVAVTPEGNEILTNYPRDHLNWQE